MSDLLYAPFGSYGSPPFSVFYIVFTIFSRQSRQTARVPCQYVTEIEVFHLLDRLKPTAARLDMLPAWFLRLGAAVFAAPLALLLNQHRNSPTAMEESVYHTYSESCAPDRTK